MEIGGVDAYALHSLLSQRPRELESKVYPGPSVGAVESIVGVAPIMELLAGVLYATRAATFSVNESISGASF